MAWAPQVSGGLLVSPPAPVRVHKQDSSTKLPSLPAGGLAYLLSPLNPHNCFFLYLEHHSLTPLSVPDPSSPAPTFPGGLGLVLGSHLPPPLQKGMSSCCQVPVPYAFPPQSRACHHCPPQGWRHLAGRDCGHLVTAVSPRLSLEQLTLDEYLVDKRKNEC